MQKKTSTKARHEERARRKGGESYRFLTRIDELGPGLFAASFDGIEFSRLAYGHNALLEATNKYLQDTSLKMRVEILTKGQGFARNEAEDRALMEIQYHAAGITNYITSNLHFMFGSMMEAYIQVGALHARQDADRQSGLDPEPITADDIQNIFSDLALQFIKQQAHATEGRRPDTPEKWRKEMEIAIDTLRRQGRKLTYEEAEDVLNLGTGTLKGAAGRHQLGSHWRALKKK